MHDTDKRMMSLETKVSYQEYMIQELNEVLISQQKQISLLQDHLTRIQEQLKSVRNTETSRPEDEPPPPHY